MGLFIKRPAFLESLRAPTRHIFYSILFYSILFYSILFCSVLFYSIGYVYDLSLFQITRAFLLSCNQKLKIFLRGFVLVLCLLRNSTPVNGEHYYRSVSIRQFNYIKVS